MQSSKELKVMGALGPCFSLGARAANVSENELGVGGTNLWRLCSLSPRTTLAFYFEVVTQVRFDYCERRYTSIYACCK